MGEACHPLARMPRKPLTCGDVSTPERLTCWRWSALQLERSAARLLGSTYEGPVNSVVEGSARQCEYVQLASTLKLLLRRCCAESSNLLFSSRRRHTR